MSKRTKSRVAQQFEKFGLTQETFPSVRRDWVLGLLAGHFWTSYGLPFEIFQDMARERAAVVDRKAFDFYMEWHATGLGSDNLVVYRDNDGVLRPVGEVESGRPIKIVNGEE